MVPSVPTRGDSATDDRWATWSRFLPIAVCLVALVGFTGPVSALGSPNVAQQDGECFGPDVFESPAGDLVEVTTSCSGFILVGGDRTPDDTRQTNYFDILYVPSGQTTFTVNTRLLGTDAESNKVYSGGVVSYAHKYGADRDPDTTAEFDELRFVDKDGTEIATNLSDLRNEVGITSLPRPLQPERYRLLATANGTIVVRDGGIPYAKEPLDRSNIRLTKPEFGSIVDTYIAPPLDADDVAKEDIRNLRPQWTQRATVAQDFRNIKGDRLVVEFEGSGIWGTLQALTAGSVVPSPPSGAGPGIVEELNDLPEGVHLEITQTNPESNQEPIQFDFGSASDDEAYLYFGSKRVDDDTPNPERFYLVIDTTDSSSFERGVSDGDQFRVEFAYNSTKGNRYRFPETKPGDPPSWDSAVSETDNKRIDQFPYFDSSDTTVRDSATFTVEDPYVRYEYTTREGKVILSTEPNAKIEGETNIAPGSDTSIQIVSEDAPPPDRITIADFPIGRDGAFTATADLSTLDREFPLEIEFFKREKLLVRNPVAIAADPANPAELALVEATSSVTITEGESLSALAATVENTGVANGNANVRLRIDGDLWGNRTVTVTPDRNRTVAFGSSYPSLPPGEYPYTVRLAGKDRTLSGTLVIEPGQTTEPTTTPEPDTPDTARPPTATTDDTPQSPPTRTATATPGPTTTVATNASAPSEASGGSLLGGLVGYVTSVLPFTLGSMVFVILAYVVARAVVARRGGSESAS